MFQLHIKYLGLAFLLLITEIFIALFVHDKIIRPYGGDFLVVILLYCVIKSVSNWEVINTAAAVLLFSYIIEILQYFNLVKFLGLENSGLAHTVLGTSFSWADMLAYTLGIVFIIVIELKWRAVSSV